MLYLIMQYNYPYMVCEDYDYAVREVQKLDKEEFGLDKVAEQNSSCTIVPINKNTKIEF